MSKEQVVDPKKNLRRVMVSSILGAVIEWYDFFLYGVVAGLFFNELYFPEFDARIGTMLAFATFAVGFVARPLGGMIFGHFGDKLGRKKMLIITLQLMGISTICIGLIPPYAAIGVWAPILLIVCRLVQGIGLGGEWGGSVLMAYESAPAGKRSFYGSLPQIGLSLGLLLSSGVVGLLSVLLSNEDFLNWGWRLAFVSSAVLVYIGYYIRVRVQESQQFTEAKAAKKDVAEEVKYPLLDAFKRYPKMLIACMGARFIDGVAFNVFAVYSLTYLAQELGLDRSLALTAVMIAACVMTFFIPCAGYLADRVSKAKIFAVASLLLGLSAFPSFWILHNFSQNYFLVCVALVVPLGILYGFVYGVEASFFSDSFDPSVRYSSISFVYQFSAIFASGITPMIATYLSGLSEGEPWLLCAYLTFVGVMSSLAALWAYSMYKKQTA